ncbi:MAG: hypothetical protein FWD71_06535 [Oscillospiraceae bacterium]|nr:hypothetical protein [Oscillospiraceae bacterium]
MRKVFKTIISVLLIFILIICTSSCSIYWLRGSETYYTYQNFFKYVDDGVEQYQLHQPENKKEGAKYPVLIHLHGRGEDSNTAAYTYFYSLLTCYPLIGDLIHKINTDRNDYESYVVLPIEDGDWGPDPETIKNIIDYLVNDEDADPNRIYITGVSMGAFAVSDFIFAYPDIPACAVMISGCNYNSEKAPDVLSIPIRLYHSDDDAIVPVDTARNFYNDLMKLGDENIEYFEYTGYGHSCWEYVYNKTDVIKWMYLQDK